MHTFTLALEFYSNKYSSCFYNCFYRYRYMCKRGVSCIIALILLMYSLSIKAQESYEIYGNDSSSVARTKIYYPVNRVDILENYMGNSEELAKIKRLLLEFPRIDSVIIYSYASPEGRYEFNRWLATERGKAAKRYILANLPKDRTLSDSLIHLRFVPENWEGMRSEIVSKYPLSDKAKVLEIIDRKDISDAQREQLLRTLNGGQPWQFIIKNIMPQLRYAAGISVWYPFLF